MNLLQKGLQNFGIYKKEFILIIWFRSTKPRGEDFRNYENPIDIFENLGDGNVNPREVSKNQNNFKSD